MEVELALEDAEPDDAVVHAAEGLVPPLLPAFVGEPARVEDLSRAVLHVRVDVVGHATQYGGVPVALVRPPGRSYPECLVRDRVRRPIDLDRALVQHAAYAAALRAIGFDVRALAPLDDLPDACFVEDVALVFPEVAVLLRPGAPQRRPEVLAIAPVLADLKANVIQLHPPARIDGGDVLRIGRLVFVGLSSRTDAAGVGALREALSPFGYEVRTLPVRRGLHLQSAVCAAGPDLVLSEPGAVDADALGVRVVFVDGPVNVLSNDGAVLLPASAARAAEVLAREGLRVVPVDLGEFEKGDAGATCLSLR